MHLYLLELLFGEISSSLFYLHNLYKTPIIKNNIKLVKCGKDSLEDAAKTTSIGGNEESNDLFISDEGSISSDFSRPIGHECDSGDSNRPHTPPHRIIYNQDFLK
ncbi:15956_t:CDS:2 [Dentiscutata erythropus]|uniref:15956_t:CDS:1 n=1 Tax=Dentiscutata erythropus TaxID=1348616 RepID=A0A9N8WF01_9GLOM|nr:15956_t:CDS:2 [Dentiscutata erythropus]